MFIKLKDEILNLNTITKIKKIKRNELYNLVFLYGDKEIKSLKYDTQNDIDMVYDKLVKYIKIKANLKTIEEL